MIVLCVLLALCNALYFFLGYQWALHMVLDKRLKENEEFWLEKKDEWIRSGVIRRER